MEMESTGKKKSSASTNMLAPGFRFHPTDEELVRYYLRRKVCGKTFQLDAIAEIDIYKTEPWDLPSMSRLKSRDLEWYFFSVLDRKYGNGARTNRATEKGYWKTTGKDREVYHRKQIVGMKKTLVYHNGRAPKGQRSNWVMHEYRLVDLELAGISQDAFVLCRVFQKSGSGPKNGEQYGAPFLEEEWENDELESVPKVEALEEEDFGDDAYLDGNYLEQILGSDVSSDITHPQLNFQSADGHGGETAESVSDTEDPQKLLDCADQPYYGPEQLEDTNLYGLPTHDMNINLVKHEYIGESSKSGNSEDLDYLLDEPFLDSTDYLPFGGDGFIEANDLSNPLSNPIEANTSTFDMFEEYLTYFDASEDYSQNFAPDLSAILESEGALVSDHTSVCPKQPNEETKQDVIPSGQIVDNGNGFSAPPLHNQESANYQSDFKYPFIKQASRMLGNIHAPPAFAEEFPLKNATMHFNSVPQSSSSVHFTAGMIQLRNLTVGNNGTVPPSRKHENLNIILSFGFSRGEDGSANLESRVSIHPGKTVSAITRDWLYFIFLSALVLSMTFKIGVHICAN